MNDNKKLYLGITGNRDISKEQKVLIKIELLNILEEILQGNKEIVIVTPLADGVDRIIAEVVLENQSLNSFEFLMPLPFSEEIYLQTFGKGLKINPITSEESIHEYNNLKQQIQTSSNKKRIILNLPFNKDLYLSSNEVEQRLIRRKQYELLGDYLINNTDILIAVYDEKREIKQGGTLEIVNKYKKLKSDEKKLFTIKL